MIFIKAIICNFEVLVIYLTMQWSSTRWVNGSNLIKFEQGGCERKWCDVFDTGQDAQTPEEQHKPFSRQVWQKIEIIILATDILWNLIIAFKIKHWLILDRTNCSSICGNLIKGNSQSSRNMKRGEWFQRMRGYF